MADFVLSEAERDFLRALNESGVRFMLVGMSGALLQGARGSTEDLDIWFESTAHPGIGEAARRVGGFWASGAFGMRPPALGGAGLGDRFDVVLFLHGLGSFEDEYAHAVSGQIDGIPIRLLPLKRILASKRAAGRAKDLAQTPALEEAIAALEALGDDPG
jgi:hypothetical protein